MLVSEFQDILKRINQKFIKSIDILNNYVDLYNEDTKKAVKVSICNSKDLFKEAIFEAVRQINEKFTLNKDTIDFLKLISNHWYDHYLTFSIIRASLDYYIEIRNSDQNFVIGKYIIAPAEALRITKYFEGIENPKLKELLDIIK